MQSLLRSIPLSFYFSAAFALLWQALPLMGIQSLFLGYGLFVVAILLFLVGCIRGVPRLLAWTKTPFNEGDELNTKEQWREDALDKYLDHMQRWLEDEGRPLATLPHDDPRRKMARTRTLRVLKRLDPDGKRDVLRFLHEHALIGKGSAVISLNGADLSASNLTNMDLQDANLSSANLRGADLSDARFNGEHGSSFSIQKAMQRDAPPYAFNTFWRCADLSWADLRGAVLRRARLSGCNLMAAKCADADFEEADLRGADLRVVRDVNQKQIERAYGTHQQDEFLPDTMLPDGLEPPAAWRRLFHEQRAGRG